MVWMNDYEVEQATDFFSEEETPNLLKGAKVLQGLAHWTNHNSEGWHVWPKPARAASKLTEALEQGKLQYLLAHEQTDITNAELRKLLTPIKSFLTRQGVDHDEVLGQKELV